MTKFLQTRNGILRGAAMAGAAAMAMNTGWAASFTIDGTTSTAAQSLGNDQTGAISTTGTLAVGGATVAVTVTGSNVSILNGGLLDQTGSERTIRSNTNGVTLTITNSTGAIIRSNVADTIQVNKANNRIVLNNFGSIIALNNGDGGQAIDWNAITSAGSNTLNNFGGALIKATNADAVRPGVNGTINNSGTIQAVPVIEDGDASGSDGVDTVLNTGVQVFNGTGGLISGRHGITGGSDDGDNAMPYTIAVTNSTGGVIQGVNGSAINIDGSLVPSEAAVVTVNNAGTMTGTYNPIYANGDGDGIDVDGRLNLTNSGTIRALGSSGMGSDGGLNSPQAVSIGGGTINNTGVITSHNYSGTTEAGAILADNSSGGDALFATEITNSGLIQGDSGYGVKIVGTFADTITNEASGTISGASATGATVQMGGGNDTLTNRGTILSGPNGLAIDMEGGDDTVRLQGGSVLGKIDGGGGTNTLQFDAGAGKSVTHSGAISNFSQVQVVSGTARLTGTSDYTGVTQIQSAGTLVLATANALSAGSSLELDGGKLKMENIGAADGQTFASLNIVDSSIIDLNSTTTITFENLGGYVVGKTLAIDNYNEGLADYAIRFAGDLTGDADFQALLANTTVNGTGAQAVFEDGFTKVVAVPEPATVALSAAGLTALLILRRRRKAMR